MDGNLHEGGLNPVKIKMLRGANGFRPGGSHMAVRVFPFAAPRAGLVALLCGWLLASCAVQRPFDQAALCATSALPCAPFALEEDLGRITEPLLNEASGLVVSRSSNERLWTINDSGGEAALYMIDGQGNYLGRVEVQGARNVDWEELASFSYEGRPHLVIADVGDNAGPDPAQERGNRPWVTLYVVEEPSFSGPRPPLNARVPVLWQQEFTYPDGPRDCESVAVDPASGKLLLISKRTNPPVLYELPLGPEYAGTRLLATRVAEVTGLPMPNHKDKLPDGRKGRLAFQNTAMDIADDGRSAVVLTYNAAWLFERGFDEGWGSAFARDPQLVAAPVLRQAEALALAPDGRLLYLTSEGIPAPLLRFSRRPPAMLR